jgi:hypothetical protein
MPKMQYEEVVARIRGGQVKAASDTEAVHGIKDPADKGTVAPKDHPDGDSNEKKQLPDTIDENKSREGQDLTDKDTNPSSTGENVPGPVVDGKAKEEAATEPNTPLSKIAGDVTDLVSRIKGLQEKSASGEAKEEPKEEPKEEAKEEAKEEKEAGASDDDTAATEGIDLSDPQACMKLAHFIQEDEDIMELVTKKAAIAQGAAEAAQLIKEATAEQEAYLEALVQEEMQKEAAEKMDAYFQELIKNASEEDIAMLLSELVEAGEIDEETAMAVMEALASEGGGEELPPEAKMASELFEKIAGEKTEKSE